MFFLYIHSQDGTYIKMKFKIRKIKSPHSKCRDTFHNLVGQFEFEWLFQHIETVAQKIQESCPSL